jgi:hypothetical protein
LEWLFIIFSLTPIFARAIIIVASTIITCILYIN